MRHANVNNVEGYHSDHYIPEWHQEHDSKPSHWRKDLLNTLPYFTPIQKDTECTLFTLSHDSICIHRDSKRRRPIIERRKCLRVRELRDMCTYINTYIHTLYRYDHTATRSIPLPHSSVKQHTIPSTEHIIPFVDPSILNILTLE